MENLEALGWYLSDHGYSVATESGSIVDTQRIVKRLLDLDLREIGSGNGDVNQGNIVLQIQKIRNISTPKGNEESRAVPRMLKLSLTDGKNNFQALEIEHITGLNLNIPPGTKILIKSGALPSSHGILLLMPSYIVQVLGGRVTNLAERWELNKKLALHTRVRSAEEGGPPPWIPFGKKIIKASEQDKNFKSLVEKEKPNKENTEFETQRKDAIAEATKQGSKKVFGGGNKQLLDHSVQKIVDRGFTVEQAEYALRINRNNVDRALKSLQKTDNKNNAKEPREPRGKRFDKKTEESKPSSGKISLFDFLEDKLPVQFESIDTLLTQSNHTQNNESNHDRLESRGADSQSGRGGRNQKGSRGYQPPPRHSEEHKNGRRTTNNSGAVSYSQYNGGAGHAQQSKPPRFQRNQQELPHQYQHNGERDQRSSQTNENYKSTFTQPRASNAIAGDNADAYNKNQAESQGRSLGSNRNSNHIEPEIARNRQSYDASYGRHNRAQQDGASKVYSSNTGEKNFKNQLRYQPNNNVAAGNNRMPVNLKAPRSESDYGSQNAASAASGNVTWVWRIGDKCMAKYWEDNRYYNAEVTGVSERTCVVQFKGFENYEEVLQLDCIPITDDYQIQDQVSETRRQEQRPNNRQPRYDQQNHNHINTGMEFRRGGSGAVSGNKGYNKKRNQQRSTQPIYQPPAQRSQYSTMSINSQNNTQYNSFL